MCKVRKRPVDRLDWVQRTDGRVNDAAVAGRQRRPGVESRHRNVAGGEDIFQRTVDGARLELKRREGEKPKHFLSTNHRREVRDSGRRVAYIYTREVIPVTDPEYWCMHRYR